MWKCAKKTDAAVTPVPAGTVERRKMHRVSLILNINCTASGCADSFHIATKDISVPGIRFVSSRKLEAGQAVSLQILLYSQVPPVTACGHVVWCREHHRDGKCWYEGGIEFTTLNERDAHFLSRFISRFTIASYDCSLLLN